MMRFFGAVALLLAAMVPAVAQRGTPTLQIDSSGVTRCVYVLDLTKPGPDKGVSTGCLDTGTHTWATFGAPTGAIVGTTDAQTLTNKTILGSPLITSVGGIVGDYMNGPTWINAYLPGSADHTPLTAAATINQHWAAFLSGTKTSLTSISGDSLLADSCLNLADNTVIPVLSWCRYSETIIPTGSLYRFAAGEENSVENLAATAGFEDPFSINPTPTAINLRLSAGIGTGASPFNLTAALDIVNNDGRYNSGIVISQQALDTSSGYADAISTGVSEGLSFYSSAGTRAVRIFLNSTSAPANAEQMIFGNNTFDLYLNGGAVHSLAVTTSGLAIAGGFNAAGATGGTATKYVCSDNSGNWFAQVSAC